MPARAACPRREAAVRAHFGCGLRRRLAARWVELSRRFGLDLADRLFERKALARDVGFRQGRRHAAQLGDQRRARALVERTTVLAVVLVETGDGAGYERVIISHCISAYSFRPTNSAIYCSNGFCIRIVSSRSGLVDSSATGQPTSSSIRRTYLIACAGNSAHERARAVGSCQPPIVS